jgi:hypothetical protein
MEIDVEHEINLWGQRFWSMETDVITFQRDRTFTKKS